MGFLVPTLFIVLVSFLIVRTAAVAFTLTGLEYSKAKFQALSAFTGTGFTTQESETIVNHPQRRRIATWLMIMGNAGIVTVIVAGTSSIVRSEGYHVAYTVAVLIVGIALIAKFSSRSNLILRWERFVSAKMAQTGFFGGLGLEDLVHLTEGRGLMRINVAAFQNLTGVPLASVNLPARDTLVLGIERGRDWIHLPGPTETLMEGDGIIVYGNVGWIKNLMG